MCIAQCKLFPLKLAVSEQECFAQEEDMIDPRGVQFAPLGIQDQSSSGEKPLNRCRRCWCSQVPEEEFQCKCQDNLLWVPGMNDPSRPAKHPEILTLALPRPSPKDFDPCPTPPRPKGKKICPVHPWWVPGKAKALPLCQ